MKFLFEFSGWLEIGMDSRCFFLSESMEFNLYLFRVDCGVKIGKPH